MSLLLASSRRCDGGMTTDDFPPGSTDGQVWLWDASAGAWVLRVLTAADVGALADDYAPAWGDVTGKPSTYPPSSHSHSWSSLTSRPFVFSKYNAWTLRGDWTVNAMPLYGMHLVMVRVWQNSSIGNIFAMASNDHNRATLNVITQTSPYDLSVYDKTRLTFHSNIPYPVNVTMTILSFDY
jgi:hypothetical protein